MLSIVSHPDQLAMQSLQALQKAWHSASMLSETVSVYVIEHTLRIIQQYQGLPLSPVLQQHFKRLEQQLIQYRRLTLPPALSHLSLSDKMICPWIEANTDDLPKLVNELGNTWKTQIQSKRQKHKEHLVIALSKLPFSAAFNESVKALRHLLRTRTSTKHHYYLQLLYWLAVVHALTRHSHLSPTGTTIASIISGDSLMQLPIRYDEIGTDFLPLLNNEDKKKLRLNWGEPTQHQSPQSVFARTYQSYLQQFNK